MLSVSYNFLAIILAIVVTGPGADRAVGLTEINMGMLALRDEAKTMKMWSPTAKYLTDSIPGYVLNVV